MQLESTMTFFRDNLNAIRMRGNHLRVIDFFSLEHRMEKYNIFLFVFLSLSAFFFFARRVAKLISMDVFAFVFSFLYIDVRHSHLIMKISC